ncbi:MAG TPA: hypothetical protein VF168_04875 [Trueperaceae bacterium]
MILPLLLSSFAAGLIATAVMVFFLYLPRAWQGATYDVMGALGSAMTGRENGQSRFMGTTTYFLVGILIALLYGWIVLALLEDPPVMGPSWPVFPGAPVHIDLLFPLLGALIGFVHGLVVALLVAVIVIEHHPIVSYREKVRLIPSQVLGHVVYGATVMFFHHQFLQLLLSLRS